MNVPFTTSLRSRPATVRIGTATELVISLRVQVPEVWDTIRVDAPADTAVSVLKERALEVLLSGAVDPEDFVMKLAGWEVLDENASLSAAGATSGSIFLLTSRRRSAVR